jgi:hypothetical protein
VIAVQRTLQKQTFAGVTPRPADPLLMGAERIFRDVGEVNSWSYRD